MSKPTNQDGILHPIFKDVKPSDLPKIKQSQILLVLKLRTEGYSYNQISRRLFAEYEIDITPQRVGQLISKYGEEYWRTQA